MTNLEFKLLDSLLHSNDVLFKRSLLSFQSCQLLLKSLSFSVLVGIVALDFFLDSMKLVCKSLASILALHGKHTFKSFFLWSENLNFLLMSVELLLKLADAFIQIWELSLEMSCVVRSLHQWLSIEGLAATRRDIVCKASYRSKLASPYLILFWNIDIVSMMRLAVNLRKK